MVLESKHLNIGSCWIGLVPNVQYENYISKLLGVPKNKRIFCMISLGYFNEEKEVNNFYSDK